MAVTSPIEGRKNDHIALCSTADVGFRARTTLLECVRLVHDALPDLAVSELDTRVTLFGKELRAPILIAAMTGGSEEAGRINRQLAQIADERGYAFGLGSQRAMLKRPEAKDTYDVRQVAPNVCLLGNLGIVQAAQLTTQQVKELAESVGADALCIHLNPAMELIQKDGDRDFKNGLETLRRLSAELPLPVIVKETGCGLSRGVGVRLRSIGIRHADVSGAGGTSWVGVETHRAKSSGHGAGAILGDAFWDWGIPTAASVVQLAPLGFDTIFATGGVGSGLDAARAIALGASVAGIARPVLRALHEGGVEGAARFLDDVESSLRAAMLLTGSRTIADLRAAPRMITGELRDWTG